MTAFETTIAALDDHDVMAAVGFASGPNVARRIALDHPKVQAVRDELQTTPTPKRFAALIEAVDAWRTDTGPEEYRHPHDVALFAALVVAECVSPRCALKLATRVVSLPRGFWAPWHARTLIDSAANSR